MQTKVPVQTVDVPVQKERGVNGIESRTPRGANCKPNDWEL